MLEACQYSDDFPISIRIVNMNEDPLHYHHDIEFIFVLEGEIELKMDTAVIFSEKVMYLQTMPMRSMVYTMPVLIMPSL